MHGQFNLTVLLTAYWISVIYGIKFHVGIDM